MNDDYREYLEERKDEWLESRRKMIEKFPFLTLACGSPYPAEVRVWRDYLHLDGYICFFSDEAHKAIRQIGSDPKSIERDIAAAEDGYFSDNTDECPYGNGFSNFEEYFYTLVNSYNQLQEENEMLRKRLGEKVSE